MDSQDPIALTVIGKNTVRFTDVLVGEVWLCSGQSNMSFPLRSASTGAEAISTADHPNLRLFKSARAYTNEPQADLPPTQWQASSPEAAKEFSAVGYFFAMDLAKDIHCPIGLIESDWGGTRAEAWLPRPVFDSLKLPYEPAWTDLWLHPKPTSTGEPGKQRPYEAPSTIYNGMIAPIAGFAVRGVVWYQGETNTAYPADYRRVLSALITSWRAAWQQGDFPFLVVQLANFETRTRDWPTLRWSQSQVAHDLPNVGLAVTFDLGGDAKNIHYKDKQSVGHRVALVARHLAYGQADIPYSGPTLKSAQANGSQVTLTFDHADGGLLAKGDTLNGFELAGPDGKFVRAKAKIEGDKIQVHADDIASPTAVRYGWANNPQCTLYNRADLPAPPFEAPLK
jgi:sialate O-acetylesterase